MFALDTLIGVTADGADVVKICGQDVQATPSFIEGLTPEEIEEAKKKKKIVDAITG